MVIPFLQLILIHLKTTVRYNLKVNNKLYWFLAEKNLSSIYMHIIKEYICHNSFSHQRAPEITWQGAAVCNYYYFFFPLLSALKNLVCIESWLLDRVLVIFQHSTNCKFILLPTGSFLILIVHENDIVIRII